jgi:ketosteroid isomerase-like protein
VPTNNLTTVPDGLVANQQTEQEAINRVVDAYVDAFNKKDPQALWRVWSNPPPKTKQAMEAYFRNARSIVMNVTDRTIQSNGFNGTVMAQSSQEFTPKNGSLQKSPEGPITFELEKRSGSWIITLVR